MGEHSGTITSGVTQSLEKDMTTRIAEVFLHSTITVEVVKAYLPSNYKVIGVKFGTEEETEEFEGTVGKPCKAIIAGKDRHGWTLNGYVIPRLGSGMIAAREIFV
jgi:hypothetical protein